MKKQIKHIFTISIIFCLTILITSCPSTPSYYVAFGDSVSAGFGLASPEESHPALFFNMLKNDEYVDDYVNMAVSGFTTSMLLEYLNNIDNNDLEKIKNAKIITLNIGGNNILVPTLSYLSNSRVASGVSNIRSGRETVSSGILNTISRIKSRVENSISVLDDTIAVVSSAISGMIDIITGLDSILTGTEEIISGAPHIIDTLTGSLSSELREELERGVQIFSDEFKDIITWLETKAPKAIIIVNTIYNPVPREVLTMHLEISVIANVLINSMNSIIIQESESRGYLVTDIYTHLSNQLNMMKVNLNPSAGELSYDIVHPNAEGHNLIAQLNYETFLQWKK